MVAINYIYYFKPPLNKEHFNFNLTFQSCLRSNKHSFFFSNYFIIPDIIYFKKRMNGLLNCLYFNTYERRYTFYPYSHSVSLSQNHFKNSLLCQLTMSIVVCSCHFIGNRLFFRGKPNTRLLGLLTCRYFVLFQYMLADFQT